MTRVKEGRWGSRGADLAGLGILGKDLTNPDLQEPQNHCEEVDMLNEMLSDPGYNLPMTTRRS